MRAETLDVLTKLGASADDFASLDFNRQNNNIQFENLVRVESQNVEIESAKVASVFLGAGGVLAYIVEFRQRNATRESRSLWIEVIHKKLMTCGDAAMMVIVDKGWVEVFPLQQRHSPDNGTVIELHPGNAMFFRSMALGVLPDVLMGRQEWVTQKLNVVDEFTTLITNTVYRLSRAIDKNLAYILTVKAVLIRLLLERHLCTEEALAAIDTKQPFAAWEQSLGSFGWLDNVIGFNSPSINQSDWVADLRKSYLPLNDGLKPISALANIFIEPASVDGKFLEWGHFDLGYAQLVQIAEAFQRAHSILFMLPGARKVKPAVSADLSILLAAESINSQDSNLPRVLIATSGCGQLPVRALTQLAITHCSQTSAQRPSLNTIENIISDNIRCLSTYPIFEYITTALIRINGFDLSGESHPVLPDSKSNIRPELLFEATGNTKSEVVIGDYSEDGDYGRSAILTCKNNCLPHGTLALSISNKLVAEDFVRIPPVFRKEIQLTAVVSGIKVPGHDSITSVIIAKNAKPVDQSEFWFSVPYKTKFGIGIGHNWVDAANTAQVSQLLLNNLPELPSVLTRLSISESSILIRVWRTLLEPSSDFELTDASLTAFCLSLIRSSVVGQFLLKALTGDAKSSRKFPIERLKTLTPSVRALVGTAMESGAEFGDQGAVKLIETLCAVDKTDITIMERFLADQGAVQLSRFDFATQLKKRLAPFFNQETFFVMDRTPSKESRFSIFSIGNKWKNDYEGLDFLSISSSLANKPVSSRDYVPLDDGRLILLIGVERLNTQELDVVTIEILRKFAGAIERDTQWLGA